MINKDLPPLTKRIKQLPLDDRGYPVPFFVSYIDGKPDFRVVDGEKIEQAIRHHLCWVCGQGLGANLAFVIGPMCAVNRVSAEPPMHYDCAMFSVKGCPFLLYPTKIRRENDMPPATTEGAGIMIKRNPGVTLVWMTKKFKIESDGDKGVLFRIGEPHEWFWFKEGRESTRAEVLESVMSGLPILEKIAKDEGKEAELELATLFGKAEKFFPEE